MSHEPHHLSGDTEDPSSASTWVVGVMFVFLVLVTVLFVSALAYDAEQDEIMTKVVDPDPSVFAIGSLRARQQAQLEGEPRIVEYRHEVSDEVVEALVIPIDDAMDLVTAEYGGR